MSKEKKRQKKQKLAEELFELGKDLIMDPRTHQMEQFMQHGTASVFEHVLSVARTSLSIANKFQKIGIKFDRRSIARGAILHDYFLYDWHEKNEYHNTHGFTHPGRAFKNASRDFELNDKEGDVIRKHMFPLTGIPPTRRESWMVCLADKWCALCETFKKDISSELYKYICEQYQLELQKTVE